MFDRTQPFNSAYSRDYTEPYAKNQRRSTSDVENGRKIEFYYTIYIRGGRGGEHRGRTFVLARWFNGSVSRVSSEIFAREQAAGRYKSLSR